MKVARNGNTWNLRGGAEEEFGPPKKGVGCKSQEILGSQSERYRHWYRTSTRV